MLRDSVAKFAQDVLSPRVQAMDQKGELDEDIVAALFGQGLMGIEAPAELGGVGLNFTAACLAVEEIAKVDPAVAVVMDIHNTLLITAFNRYATQEQKENYLSRLATNTVGSFCLSEPVSGSDAFAMKTRAVQDGSDFIIEGN